MDNAYGSLNSIPPEEIKKIWSHGATEKSVVHSNVPQHPRLKFGSLNPGEQLYLENAGKRLWERHAEFDFAHYEKERLVFKLTMHLPTPIKAVEMGDLPMP